MNCNVPSIALCLALAATPALAVDPPTNPIARGNTSVDIERCKDNHFILRTPDPCTTPQDFEWSATSDMHDARLGHTATLLKDGTVLVAGGGVASAELYDPRAGTWTLTGALSHARQGHTATLLASGKVLVMGGPMPSAVPVGYIDIDNSFEIYDPATRQWTAARGMQIPRTDFTATLLDTGKVLVVGGLDKYDNTVRPGELYDPETDTWALTGFSSGLFWHTATKLRDGRVLIAGGVLDDWLSIPIDGSEIYDPASGEFDFAGNMRFARGLHDATLLDDGSVLLSGGFYKDYNNGGWCNFTTIAFSERYDPAVGHWILGGLQNVPRMAHTATLLGDHTVLLTGGDQSSGGCPNIVWSTIQNSERTGANALTWTQETSTRSPRAGHTATLLPDGSVLVAGGRNSPNGYVQPMRSAELYRPVAAH